MSEKRLDVHEFLMNDIMIEDVCKTKKILGVFEDELYCILKEDIVNTKAVTYYIDKINDEMPINFIVVSEMTEDEIQTIIVEHLSKKNIKFKFVAAYNPDDGAYMVIQGKEDIQRDPFVVTTDIPQYFLKTYGGILCKEHAKELKKHNNKILNDYKKETFLTKGSCSVCRYLGKFGKK